MYAGHVLETGATAELLDAPAHPYTLGLLEAVVDLDDPVGAPLPIPGSIPDPADLPTGCPFHPRCAFASADCAEAPVVLRPPAELIGPVGPPAWAARRTACIHPERLLAGAPSVPAAVTGPASGDPAGVPADVPARGGAALAGPVPPLPRIPPSDGWVGPGGERR